MAENKGYMTLSDEQGSIHISEEVIAAIAVGAVREVEGVSGLVLDIYLTVAYGHAIPEVAENAQKAVASAVSAMTGCTVETVNIHVGGVTLA